MDKDYIVNFQGKKIYSDEIIEAKESFFDALGEIKVDFDLVYPKMPTIDCDALIRGPIKRMTLESVFLLYSFIKDKFNYRQELQADLRLSPEDVRFSFD
jgi:hypothetical protein